MSTTTTPNGFYETSDCALCFTPLAIQIENDTGDNDPSSTSSGSSIIPDDVQIQCRLDSNNPGHHFHWACLQELDESGQWDRSKCPLVSCGGNPLDNEGRLLVVVRNEGGVTSDFNLGRAFDEEKEESVSRKKELAMLDAARKSEWDVVEDYLASSVDANATDDDENRIAALHIAAYLGDLGLEPALVCLKHGADPYLKTADGYSAFDIARFRQAPELISFLEEATKQL